MIRNTTNHIVDCLLSCWLTQPQDFRSHSGIFQSVANKPNGLSTLFLYTLHSHTAILVSPRSMYHFPSSHISLFWFPWFWESFLSYTVWTYFLVVNDIVNMRRSFASIKYSLTPANIQKPDMPTSKLPIHLHTHVVWSGPTAYVCVI